MQPRFSAALLDDEATTVTLRVMDNAGNWSDSVAELTIYNVAPSVTGLFLYGTIFENGSITLNNSFTDPGLLDQHTLIVDWDDPNNPADSTFALPATGTLTAGSTFASSTDNAVLTVYQLNAATGRVDFRVTHQYRDDGVAPGNGTSPDLSVLRLTVSDDDGGNLERRRRQRHRPELRSQRDRSVPVRDHFRERVDHAEQLVHRSGAARPAHADRGLGRSEQPRGLDVCPARDRDADRGQHVCVVHG